MTSFRTSFSVRHAASTAEEKAAKAAARAEKKKQLELQVAEQRSIMFPTLGQLEEAQREQDDLRQSAVAATPSDDWSPKPSYKVWEKHDTVDDLDNDEDSDSEENQKLGADATETADEPDLQVGIGSEAGFKYKGPEPTLYGDWAHKGRVSDF